MARPKRHLEECAYESATASLKAIAGRWKLLVLVCLVEEGPRRYGELRRSIPGISQKMLSTVLDELRADELIERTELVSEAPKHVEYRLTPLGMEFEPLLTEMRAFGLSLLATRRGNSTGLSDAE